MPHDDLVRLIVESITKSFSTFGGHGYVPSNPLSSAFAEEPPMFAMGVDVEQVVRHVFAVLVGDRR